MKIAGISVYTARGQLILMLLECLKGFRGGHPKSEVIQDIESRGWFKIEREDRIPYQSVTTGEPRWATAVAYARKDCVDHGLMMNDGVEDSWQIAKDGLNTIVDAKRRFAKQELDVRQCFLWSPRLKLIFDPSYLESERDEPRPKLLYNDHLPFWMRSTRGSAASRLVDVDLLRELLNEAGTEGGDRVEKS